jgi:large subunit ribosomal protein L13
MNTVKRDWYRINAEGKTLGRLATQAAGILMGKNRVDFNKHEDKGGFLVVTNAEKVKVTGSKAADKEYFFASKYPGNSKLVSYGHILEKKPEYIIYHAVKGMLPKNKLGSRMLTRLKIYAGEAHPHDAQEPVDLEIGNGNNE